MVTACASVLVDPYICLACFTVRRANAENPADDVRCGSHSVEYQIGPAASDAVPALVQQLEKRELRFEASLVRALGQLGFVPSGTTRPRFAHGAETMVGAYTLIGTFHPSQQNTFTGRLTRSMLVDIFERARLIAGTGKGP